MLLRAEARRCVSIHSRQIAVKFTHINALRVVAITGVIFTHTASGIANTRELSAFDDHVLTTYMVMMYFAVPLTLMISGALFLNPDKDASYGSMLKYVRRIAMSIVIFGLPMCLIESVLAGLGEGCSPLKMMTDAVINCLTGNSWGHMWYMYMLVCLYLLSPIVKPFVVGATDRELHVALSVLFALSCLLPLLMDYGVEISGYIVFSCPYLFIYLLGYWLQWRAKSAWTKNRKLLSALIVLCLAVLILRNIYDDRYPGYHDPIRISMAAGLFLLFKDINVNWQITNKLAPVCFGAYSTSFDDNNLRHRLF